MKKVVSSSSSIKRGFTPEKPSMSSNSSTEDQQHHHHPPQMLGADVLMIPSTSTFTLSGGKDDKTEKLKKKAKNFLDERQKTKSRAQSLWSFIDATNTFDQARFFQEHAEQIFQVVFETCMHQIEKIKHKSERPQSWSSKELVNLQKTLLLLRKIFLYVPELMRNGWQRQHIATILSYILDHGNHPRLRALGFQLLLLWLNDQVVEYPECMHLFANAISLDLFLLDDVQPFTVTSNAPNTTTTTTTTTTTITTAVTSSTANNATITNNNTIPFNTTFTTNTPTTYDPSTITNNNNNNNNNEDTSTSTTNKLHTLQFVKKLRENYAEKQINHGLQRDERIKSSQIQLHQSFILGDDSAPLFPNPTQPTFNDSILLLHIFLSNLVRLAYVAAGSPPPPDEYEYPPGDHIEADDGIATGVGIDAATASAKFLFKIFRTHYMTKFVPLISKSLQVEGSAKNGVIGFPTCPPTILRSLLRFLIGYCLDNSHNVNIHWPQLSNLSSPATPILKSIVLSSHESREMLHELLRQSLILPCTNPHYRDITRGAIHILGVWILGSEDERPSFLRRSGSIVTRSSSTASVSNSINNDQAIASSNSSRVFSTSPQEDSVMMRTVGNNSTTGGGSGGGANSTTTASTEEYSDANVFLRRYLMMIKLIFEDRRMEYNNRDIMVASVQQVTDWEGLVALYKDAINVYRAIAVSRGGIDIEWESWELMLQCLLDIQQWFMSQPEKYSRIPVQSLAEELADYIWETLLHAFVRAKILHMELWHHLKIHMVSSMRWVQALNQWVRIMQKLTRLLSARLYKVEYELYSSDNRYRLVEELPNSVTSNRYSTHFGNTTNGSGSGRALSGGAVGSSNSNRAKVRSRHLSMQSNPRHGSPPHTKRVGAPSIRPLSSSDGQLTDIKQQQQQQQQAEKLVIDQQQQPQQQQEQQTPVPEGSVSTLLRNLSSASLSDIANTFKTDRKSTNLSSVPDEIEMEEESEEITANNMGKAKFGIKHIIPTASFSTTPNSSIHNTSNVQSSSTSIGGKKSNTNTSISTGSSNGGSGTGGTPTSSVGGGGGGTEKGIGRRTISIQQLDTLWQDSGSKLLNFVHYGADTSSPPQQQPVSKNKEEEKKEQWDNKSKSSSIDDNSTKSTNRAPSSIINNGESIMINPASVTEKLPAGLGSFKSTEFLVLNNLPLEGQQLLVIWKNMLLTIGNINQMEGPQNHAIAMQCVVEIWDTLRLVRAQQPYRDVAIPGMYEVAPWLFQATELPSTFDIGKAAAYGSLCRLMSQRPEETVPEGYYAAFYKSILKGFGSNDDTIIQAIILNSERLFAFPLPGVHILIPAFIDAIEKQLLNGNAPPGQVKKSCIKILGSMVSISNHTRYQTIRTEELDMTWTRGYHGTFLFANVKILLKNLFLGLVQVGIPQQQDAVDAHCMILGALCTVVLDELLVAQHPHQDIIHECILSLVNHLYWSNLSIVNTVTDCLVSIAQVYSEKLDPEGMFVQEILSRIIDSLHAHLKFYERNIKCGRGFIISKLYNCLLEWIMVIEPMVFTETDLCQLVFDVIELALHVTSEGTEKLLPHPPPRSTHRSFKLSSEKRPQMHHDVNSVEVTENDQGYVKESAEAVLLHILHHFNNFAPPYGPATLHSTIIGPGVSQDDIGGYHQYQYFSFNDTTIIAFVELPKTEVREAQTRMIIRDLTGRYVWDTQLEPDVGTETTQVNPCIEEFVLRPNLEIQSCNERPVQSTKQEEDPMANLLKQIGDLHPDCLLDPSLSLNVPCTSTFLQLEMVGDLGTRMNEYLKNEAQNNEQQESDVRLWYSKMNMMRKKEQQKDAMQLMTNFSSKRDFLPAFPQEAEKSHVPFQQSRLLLSHMGFMHYNKLKDGSFQMLNKTPALYRDLRGLDRKHGRETMKIGLIYVGHGQEDEQSILQNNRGSTRYNAFVNSLGWEIDIGTHTGYLGGLERNLTNGTRATYYCSSTVEMIFHDVTKMPTDTSDPKQIKKKRHIGNDHVHIVWNEHDRDYRIDTIGGDFGNAQIIVTPLPDNLYSIQVYRDSKVPYFGPLFDRMIVSQAILGSMVRCTVINAFRATVHTTNPYSFYKCVYAQRANDIKTITNRHRVANWSYEQFMEKIFMPEDHS